MEFVHLCSLEESGEVAAMPARSGMAHTVMVVFGMAG
jgi:hypothetical protein